MATELPGTSSSGHGTSHRSFRKGCPCVQKNSMSSFRPLLTCLPVSQVWVERCDGIGLCGSVVGVYVTVAVIRAPRLGGS
jgi:hypothetical protein